MALAAAKTKTLTVQDLDLDVTYQGDLVSKLFDPTYSYKIIQRTEDAYLQHCSLCDRENQARYRATIVNITVGETFYVGRVCLAKYFGVTYEGLDKSTVLLASLARSWQAYKHHVGENADFESTREAVQDMYHWFSMVADQGVKPFKEAADAIGRILGDLAHIGDYRTDVRSLQNLVAIVYESMFKKGVLDDRVVSLLYHPLLTPHERSEAEKVLRADDVAWHQVRAVSEKLGAISGKNVPLKIRRVPAWNYANKPKYHDALRAYADDRLQNLNEKSDDVRGSHEFLDVMRQVLQKLKSNGGFYELVFESSSFGSVERLVLPVSLQNSVESAGGVYLMSAKLTSYLRYARTSVTHHSADSMMRAEQQDEGRNNHQPDRKPQERFYRAVVLYVPDDYSPSFEKWMHYGGIKEGRKHLEDLASELLSSAS